MILYAGPADALAWATVKLYLGCLAQTCAFTGMVINTSVPERWGITWAQRLSLLAIACLLLASRAGAQTTYGVSYGKVSQPITIPSGSGEQTTLVFTGRAGDAISLDIEGLPVGASRSPCYEMRDPTGGIVSISCTSASLAPSSVHNLGTFTRSGVFRLIIYEFNHRDMAYWMVLGCEGVCPAPPSGVTPFPAMVPVPLAVPQTFNGTVSPGTPFRTHSFPVVSGGAYTVRATRSATGSSPCLNIFTPTAAPGSTLKGCDTSSIARTFTATTTGLYTALVADSLYDNTLSYALSVSCTGTCTSPPPFGTVDTPTDNLTGVAGAIGITGWALAKAGIGNVALWRDPIAGEAASANGLVFLATATLVPGARPDVASAYPAYPGNNFGWGAQVLTNQLPNTTGSPGVGNGTYRIHVIATDVLGNTTDFATRRFTADNSHSTLPFGTIDTPAQGGTMSGSAYVSFGWALTPQPYAIPVDGSTINVFIDNVPVGHPAYGFPRADIQAIFPGLQNTNTGVGYLVIDSTKLTNGLHSIAWSVVDTGGHLQGIGSRLFFVQN